jgi:hypothetical protein
MSRYTIQEGVSMTERQKKKVAAFLDDCRKKAKNSSRECNYPGCNEKAINSHIFQKNGVLSSIAQNRHLIAHDVDFYNNHAFAFKRVGLNRVFSFDCFCAKHDLELFKTIESVEIEQLDFNVYRNCLLFVMRGLYNELNSKKEAIKFFECLIKDESGLFDNGALRMSLLGNKQGKKDVSDILKVFSDDLNNSTESFTFRVKRMKRLELCLSSSIDYETTEEIDDYRRIHGKEMEKLTPIFINFFPLKKSSLLLIGYYKSDHEKINNYIDSFFGADEDLAELGLTNLILFQCEAWVCSEDLYLSKIKDVENYFDLAANYSHNNTNERKFLPLNIFSDDFTTQIKTVLGQS